MFWERFCLLCSQSGKSPNRIAADADLFSTGMVTKYIKGATPNGEILSKVADYFGVSVDYLLGRSDSPVLIASWDDLYNSSDKMSDAQLDSLVRKIHDLL